MKTKDLIKKHGKAYETIITLMEKDFASEQAVADGLIEKYNDDLASGVLNPGPAIIQTMLEVSRSFTTTGKRSYSKVCVYLFLAGWSGEQLRADMTAVWELDNPGKAAKANNTEDKSDAAKDARTERSRFHAYYSRSLKNPELWAEKPKAGSGNGPTLKGLKSSAATLVEKLKAFDGPRDGKDWTELQAMIKLLASEVAN